MKSTKVAVFFFLIIIVALNTSLGGPVGFIGDTDVSDFDIRNVRLGMVINEAKRLADGVHLSCSDYTDSVICYNESTERRKYLRTYDYPALSFLIKANVNKEIWRIEQQQRVSEIELDEIVKKVQEKYGKPDWMKRDKSIISMYWGAKWRYLEVSIFPIGDGLRIIAGDIHLTLHDEEIKKRSKRGKKDELKF